MTPVIAIVGRPNVGKSTLFNCLTKSHNALVADMPGVTRDRQYGQGKIGTKPFIVIDTGGVEKGEQGIADLVSAQVNAAMQEADIIVFLVDGQSGVVAADIAIAHQLRQLSKPVWLVVNKTDGVDPDVVKGDFYQLGLGEPVAIAAAHRRGTSNLIEQILREVNVVEETIEPEQPGIKFALIGRPNVGKSTLTNRLLGEERVLVFDAPGTTRDSIFIPFKRRGEQYTLIDTAGIRRRSRINAAIEKFSVVKSIQAIDAANVVVLIIDARENIAEQDLRLLGHVIDAGRALVIAINKWDGLSAEQKDAVKRELSRRLTFVDFARLHFISAVEGTGVGNLFKSINEAYHSANRHLATHELTQTLQTATQAHQPPLVKGRRIKLRYAHQGGRNPPRIIIHGNQIQSVPNSYRRYLENTFRKRFKLIGTPLVVEFKAGSNPYQHRKKRSMTSTSQRSRR